MLPPPLARNVSSSGEVGPKSAPRSAIHPRPVFALAAMSPGAASGTKHTPDVAAAVSACSLPYGLRLSTCSTPLRVFSTGLIVTVSSSTSQRSMLTLRIPRMAWTRSFCSSWLWYMRYHLPLNFCRCVWLLHGMQPKFIGFALYSPRTVQLDSFIGSPDVIYTMEQEDGAAHCASQPS